MDRALAKLFVLLACPLALFGCSYDSKIVITARDPSRVAVRAEPSRSPTSLSPGEGPADVVLEQGRFATGEQTGAEYTLHVARSSDHSLNLRWDTRLPMQHGEDVTLLSAAGKLRLLDAHVDELHLAATSDWVQVPLCGELVHESGSDGDGNYYDLGYASYVEPRGFCASALQVPLELDVPASDLTVREKRTPRRGMAVLTMVVSTLCTLPLGISFVVVGNNLKSTSDTRDLGNTFATVGWIPIVVGALVDLAMLPTLVAPTQETVLYPAHP